MAGIQSDYILCFGTKALIQLDFSLCFRTEVPIHLDSSLCFGTKTPIQLNFLLCIHTKVPIQKFQSKNVRRKQLFPKNMSFQAQIYKSGTIYFKSDTFAFMFQICSFMQHLAFRLTHSVHTWLLKVQVHVWQSNFPTKLPVSRKSLLQMLKVAPSTSQVSVWLILPRVCTSRTARKYW